MEVGAPVPHMPFPVRNFPTTIYIEFAKNGYIMRITYMNYKKTPPEFTTEQYIVFNEEDIIEKIKELKKEMDEYTT